MLRILFVPFPRHGNCASVRFLSLFILNFGSAVATPFHAGIVFIPCFFVRAVFSPRPRSQVMAYAEAHMEVVRLEGLSEQKIYYVIFDIMSTAAHLFAAGLQPYCPEPGEQYGDFRVDPQKGWRIYQCSLVTSDMHNLIFYIIGHLHYEALSVLEAISEKSVFLDDDQRNRLVVCVMTGAIAFLRNTRYSTALTDVTVESNVNLAIELTRGPPQSHSLHPNMVSLGTRLPNFNFAFHRLSIFRFMGAVSSMPQVSTW